MSEREWERIKSRNSPYYTFRVGLECEVSAALKNLHQTSSGHFTFALAPLRYHSPLPYILCECYFMKRPLQCFPAPYYLWVDVFLCTIKCDIAIMLLEKVYGFAGEWVVQHNVLADGRQCGGDVGWIVR